ncbi:unnamed protein product, partial [Brassica rapa subsp. narinosa]
IQFEIRGLNFFIFCTFSLPSNQRIYNVCMFCFLTFLWQGSELDMNWVQRKIYLYNVTFGLYMLDWWERYLFNSLVVILMWFILYNGSRYFSELCKR